MRPFKTTIITTLLLTFALVTQAQDPKIISGKPESLKAIKTWNVEFVFRNPDIHKEGKEDAFVAKKTKEFNEKEKGKGDRWAKNWEENKQELYKPKFELLMNKYLKESGVKVGAEAEGAKHTIIVETTWMYLGYNVGVSSQPSKITSTISFVSDADKTKPLFQVQMIESPGNVVTSNPYSEFDRLIESYAKCGKDLAGYLSKKAYK